MTWKLRCAIYTRKSSEDGLEQDFNSLDAQREACEAFIASQASLGWKALPRGYDDGGLSGGHMERPALQRLIQDIKAGHINVVVVYKIDRLTRSLMDFARMVEIFDTYDVSFVSVTQQFNTTTSMGRLTLNVLLSFAQFEREVTAERIRDKIAASRKKGMWMGGCVPLGFDVVDRQMVINTAEAESIRTIFRLYLDLKNVRLLKHRCDELGIVTKVRKQLDGRTTGGKPFSRGNLYKLLHNPVYIGKVRHKNQIYDGQHNAIVDGQIWQAVQTALSDRTVNRDCDHNTRSASLLKGLVFDASGDRLSPSHAVKNGRRYRYYISFRLKREPRKNNNGWRLPAAELEGAVVKALQEFLCDELVLLDALTNDRQDHRFIEIARGNAKDVAAKLVAAQAYRKREILTDLIEKVVVSEDSLTITIRKPSLRTLVGIPLVADEPDPIFTISASARFKRRGVEAKIVLGGMDGCQSKPDVNLILLIARAHAWFDALSTGRAESIPALAESEGVTPNDISRILQLVFLKPSIIESILDGKQPIEMTAHTLKRAGELPLLWGEQEMRLGFAPTGSWYRPEACIACPK